jgi:O-antigen/teichoic acid export membrane protein
MMQDADVYFRDHSVSADIGRLALRGGTISVLSGYGNGVIQIVSTIVLARLLSPSDFGLVAIITALTSFAPFLIDFGMADATIQRAQITSAQVSAVFWINLGLGVAVAATLASCSGLIASAYGEPRLAAVAIFSSLTFVLGGMSAQHLALLRRTMQFTTIAKIQFLGVVAGALVAVLLAVYGAGVWALVFRPVANMSFVAVGAWLGCRWRPGRPVFDGTVKSMTHFGLNIVCFSIANTMSRAMDRIALGLFYSPRDVGYYQNAFTLYDSSIVSALSQLRNVGSAALSKLQSDHAALSRGYETALSMTTFFVMPAAAILSVTAQDLTSILLGTKWLPAGALLAILALRGIFYTIESSQGWLHLSVGRPDRWKKWGVVTVVVQMAAVLCGMPFGPRGVAIATVAAGALIAFPSISYAGRPAGIGAALAARAVGRQMFGAVTCAASGWILQDVALQQLSSIPRILVSGSFTAAIYLLIVVGMLRLTAPLQMVGRVIYRRLPLRATSWLSSRFLGG